MPAQPQPRATAGPVAAAISNAVVGLVRDYAGRGPTRARTTFGADVIVVTLRGMLTKGDRALAQRGLGTDVLAMRRAVHNAMREDMIATVEALTGRAVEALLADSLLDPDIAVAVFLMHPTTGDTANRAPRMNRP